MSTPSSGTISMYQCELECGYAGGQGVSLNDTNMRNLAGIPSGQISLSNFYSRTGVPSGRIGVLYHGNSTTCDIPNHALQGFGTTPPTAVGGGIFGDGAIYGTSAISGTYLGTPSTGGAYAWSVGTGDYTVEGWHYWPTGLTSTMDRAIISFGVASGAGIAVRITGNTTIVGIMANVNNTNGGNYVAGSWPRDTWHHFRLSRVAGTNYLFVDGGLVASVANTANLTTTTANARVRTTNSNGATSYSTVGYVDEMAVFLAWGTTGNFTPPTAPYQPY